jgi:aminoglycoside phosphotransferase (APT) family kinase protein
VGRGPDAEVEIDAALVRALLSEQHPDLAALPVEEVASGWDNVIYRLGEHLTVRLPRRGASAILQLNEQRWLPQLAPRLPLRVPVPLRIGAPSLALGYPWSFSIGPWLPGDAFEHAPPRDPVAAARSLARFTTALHQPAALDAPSNPYRGIPLAGRADLLHAHLERLGSAVDRGAVLAAFEALVRTPAWTGPPLWLHGDLHPLNLLVDQGELSAVIDFGDLCAGDPASDLQAAWMLFDVDARALFRDATRADADTWRRARGWALALAVAFCAGDERIAGIGHRTLAAVLADQG